MLQNKVSKKESSRHTLRKKPHYISLGKCNNRHPKIIRRKERIYPRSSASRFRFISRETLCCAASCLANSGGTLDTGLFEISVDGEGPIVSTGGATNRYPKNKMRTLFEIIPKYMGRVGSERARKIRQ